MERIVIRLDEIVNCPLCDALTTYSGRVQHLAWHGRLNARTHSMAGAVGLCGHVAPEVFGGSRLLCTLLYGHPGMHSDGSAHWHEQSLPTPSDTTQETKP